MGECRQGEEMRKKLMSNTGGQNLKRKNQLEIEEWIFADDLELSSPRPIEDDRVCDGLRRERSANHQSHPAAIQSAGCQDLQDQFDMSLRKAAE